MDLTRKLVIAGAACLLGIWLLSNWAWLEKSDDDIIIRLVLGSLLSILILLRPKPGGPYGPVPGWLLWGTSIGGVVMALGGIIIPVHQLHWLGIIFVIFACLSWALPDRYTRDLAAAMLLFYWIHPLPGGIFGGLQIRMQFVSVWGAEWLLHILNHEAWQDGIILRTGYNSFNVPEACSGMTTAVTVLLCSLGTAILMRFRWYEITVLVALGLLQVLGLNIIRIAHMVVAAADMPREWAENFLHDTLGMYLLVSIVLVQVEASIWRVKRVQRTRKEQLIVAGEVEHNEKATILPVFWRVLFKWGTAITLVLAIVAGIALACYKRRDHHRAEMIGRTVPGLRINNAERAEAAALATLGLNPELHGVRAELGKLLMAGKRYARGIAELSKIPKSEWDPEFDFLKAWGWTQLKEYDKAAATLGKLPRFLSESPGADMIRAEIAIAQENTSGAAEYLVNASRISVFLPRIRSLYPYLAFHEQWQIISDCDRPVPYQTVDQAHLAVKAHLRVNRPTKAADSLTVAVQQWPNEPRFLESMVALARLRPKTDWRDFFISTMLESYRSLPAEVLALHLPDCFEHDRPDLAWRVYRRLERLVPDAPALEFVFARHSDDWMKFRNLDVEIRAGSEAVSTDLRPVVLATLGFRPLRAFWREIPRFDSSLAAEPEDVRRRLEACILRLDERRSRKELTGRQLLLLADVRALVGRAEEAHDALDEFIEAFPDAASIASVRHAELYAEIEDWQSAYEAARTCRQSFDRAPMVVNLLMMNALCRLGLGGYALKLCDETVAVYGDASHVRMAEIALWDELGDDEHALHILERNEVDYVASLWARMLHNTGRFEAARRIAERNAVRDLPTPRAEDQRLYPEPAEWIITRRWTAAFTPVQMDEAARIIRESEAGGASPFVRALAKLRAHWLESRGGPGTSRIETWAAVGRDDSEKGAAVYQLLNLLAQHRRYDEAKSVVEVLVAYWPESVAAWRAYIAMTEGDRDVINRARQACPGDAHIWLADIVRGAAENRNAEWMQAQVRNGIEADYSQYAIVRAGDLMLRKGLVEPAVVAARYAETMDASYLPATMLCMRAAFATRDKEWAIESAARGADVAHEPWPFYMTMVEVKHRNDEHDGQMIKALEYLRKRFSHDLRWSEMLGNLYYGEGDMGRAFSVLAPIARRRKNDLTPGALTLTAEAARRSGRTGEALSILGQAYELYPENRDVLNNYVYTLAQRRDFVTRAIALLEERLLPGNEEVYAVLDTAALVYLRVGDLDKAEGYVRRALAMIDASDGTWAETALNSAEILLGLGRLEDALRTVEDVRSNRQSGQRYLDARSLRLLHNIEQKIAAQERLEAESGG